MGQSSKTRIILTGLALVLAVVLVLQWWFGAPVTAPVTEADVSAGSYAALGPPPRRLVDGWVGRYAAATGQAVNAGALYDGLPLSSRTTFNAVTHALGQTRLTDDSGQSMGLTALDLVSQVDAVAGRVPEAGGDKQFRLYVQLRPDTRQVLERSREFARQVDNTIYHKGYPTCFRGVGKTPNIQFSLSSDGTRADIDVDYRASNFPISLVNGHLTSSNSDVRAGNNDARHNGRWNGLQNWWRGFMGLVGGDPAPAAAPSGAAIAEKPRVAADAKPEEAIADFLQAWLVERNPGVAMGSVSPRALACLELERGTPLDRGVARFQMASAMKAVNDRIGSVGRLTDALRGVPLSGSRGREMPQPHRDAFVMYDLREDLGEAFDCGNRLHPDQADAEKAQSTDFGTYVGAVFRLQTPQVTGDAVATVWAREDDAWKLVSYDVEPEFTPGKLPAAPPPAAAEPALPVIDGDPDMVRAAGDFFDVWFARKDVAAAFAHLSPSSYGCYDVFRPEEAPAASAGQGGPLLRERMGELAAWAGAGKLADVVSGVEPHHPDLKIVKHAQADAFTVVAIPGSMAQALACDRLQPGRVPYVKGEGDTTYGDSYAAAVRLKRAGPDGAVLWTVWGRSGKAWKVASYLVMSP